jgi:hypothetical protein
MGAVFLAIIMHPQHLEVAIYNLRSQPLPINHFPLSIRNQWCRVAHANKAPLVRPAMTEIRVLMEKMVPTVLMDCRDAMDRQGIYVLICIII